MARASAIRISCKDEFGTCARFGSGTFAEAINDADDMGRPLYSIILCLRMFNSNRPLNDILADNDNKPQKEVTMNSLVLSLGGSFLHELMHIDLITGHRGHMIDETDPNNAQVRFYGPEKTARIARQSGVKETLMRNPDSYKQFALEVFYTKAFGFRPGVKSKNYPVQKCSSDDRGDTFRYVYRGELTGPIDEFCTDLGSHYTADGNNNIDGSWGKEFYPNTPLHTIFNTSWRKWARLSQNNAIQDCKTKLYQVLDGCDTNTLYKGGGSYNSDLSMGTTYSIEMQADRLDPAGIPAASCDVWYKFPRPYDEIYMKGSGFASQDHGGDILLPRLKKCGDLTGWKFDYGLHWYKGAQYEWIASGRVAIGHQQWGCVRDAMVAAGATSSLGCGGH